MNEEVTRVEKAFNPATLPSAACLVLIYGGDELGKRYALTGETRIGRRNTHAIFLDLDDVSRDHAKVANDGNGWGISDLGSTNGTQVNGRAVVGTARLQNGDLIKVGRAIFKYIAGGNIESLFHEEIYRLSVYDALTRIHNKRYFMDFLERETARASRYGSTLSLAMLDIDHFKKLNDAHGHLAGDKVLERVAGRIAGNIRREQLFARYGGEEFGLVLPELDPNQVQAVCENMRQAVEAEDIEFDGQILKATVSVGAAFYQKGMNHAALIMAADTQLYRAKHEGRNRCCIEGV
ncbi:MAG TPA: GGDEF domain-containing protein [Holophagaceae bacterium]|nr:GGDEF domain-containing protein [Holophagaceae bacterium]